MKKLTKRQSAELLTAKGELRKIVTAKFTNHKNEFSEITRTGYYSGSGRFTQACSFGNDFVNFLEVMKIKYTVGNDASRGGVSGEFVKISSRAVKKLNTLVSEISKTI